MSATAQQVAHYAGMAAELACSRRAAEERMALVAKLRMAVDRLRKADLALYSPCSDEESCAAAHEVWVWETRLEELLQEVAR